MSSCLLKDINETVETALLGVNNLCLFAFSYLAPFKDAILHIMRTNQYDILYFDKADIFSDVLISKFVAKLYIIYMSLFDSLYLYMDIYERVAT